MNLVKKIKFSIYPAIIFFAIVHLFLLLLFTPQLHCKLPKSQNVVSNSLVEAYKNPGAYEISQVVFEGNVTFLSSELLEYISSKPTNTSLPNKILTTYYHQSKKNKSFPRILVNELWQSLQQFEKEHRYFNADIANFDVQILENLYQTNGFHYVNVYYTFQPDSLQRKNVLTFYIKENHRFKLAAKINYLGLDDLPNEVMRRVDSVTVLAAGDFFSEEQIENEITDVHNILLRTGYMYANWDYSNVYVVMDSANFTDSVVVYFEVGDRIRIGEIIFVDSTNNQKVVANSTKRNIIRFAEGQYYNRPRIERSIDRLLEMRTFETVTIDTLQREYAADDFSRDFVVTSRYRMLRDWGGSLFLNRTQIDNLMNAGAESYLLHRNAFGSAQEVKLFASFAFKDVERFISSWTFPDYEFKVGVNYSQPQIWQIENNRVAFSTSLSYSWEILNGLFRISKISFPISFPTRLAWTSYFNRFSVEFNMEREVPMNFKEIETFALDSARTSMDTVNINAALRLYRNINNYLNESPHRFLTSNLLSLSLFGENLDHPFSPTQGSLTHFEVDGFNIFFSHPAISGGAKYLRFQTTHSRFWRLSSVAVLGIKGRLGLTYLFDEANTFVPQDRQFFSGGANSVRGWGARELRYSNQIVKKEVLRQVTDSLFDFAANYIGSRTLIEGSVEFRRKLSDIPGLSESIAWIFNDLGLGLFLDFGNAFGWYYEDDFEHTNIHFSDYFTKLAVSTGLGLRYDTPIGPIRIDFATPIYDPLKIKKPFRSLAFVFGIGHAF